MEWQVLNGINWKQLAPCFPSAYVWEPVSTQHKCSHICLGIWCVQGLPLWTKTSLCLINVLVLLLLTNLLMSHGNLVTWRHWKGLSKCSIRLLQTVKTELKSNSPPHSPSATRNPGLGSPHCHLHISKALIPSQADLTWTILRLSPEQAWVGGGIQIALAPEEAGTLMSIWSELHSEAPMFNLRLRLSLSQAQRSLLWLLSSSLRRQRVLVCVFIRKWLAKVTTAIKLLAILEPWARKWLHPLQTNQSEVLAALS